MPSHLPGVRRALTTHALEVLSAHAGREVAAGSAVDVAPDRVVVDGAAGEELVAAHDRSSAGRPRHVERFLFVPDPDGPAPRRRAVQRFAEKHNADLTFDPAHMGWPGVVAAEEGLVGSGDVVVGTSPDVGGLGGLGALVLRGRPDELLGLLRSDTLRLQAPDGLRVAVDGRLPRWVSPQDVALQLAAHLAESDVDARGRVLELSGRGVTDFTVEERMTLCAALAREGLAALVPPDDTTRVWLAARRTGGAGGAAEEKGGGDAAPDVTLRGPKLALVARLDGSLVKVARAPETPVHEVVVAGDIAVLRAATESVQERGLQPGLRAYLLPASRRTLLHAVEEGLLAVWLRAGAILLSPGATPPPPARGERRATTVASTPEEVLAGPAVVASSAVCGRLADPETMRREHRRTAAIR